MPSAHLKNGNDSIAGDKAFDFSGAESFLTLDLGMSASNKTRDDPDWVVAAISGFIFIFQLQIS